MVTHFAKPEHIGFVVNHQMLHSPCKPPCVLACFLAGPHVLGLAHIGEKESDRNCMLRSNAVCSCMLRSNAACMFTS